MFVTQVCFTYLIHSGLRLQAAGESDKLIKLVISVRSHGETIRDIDCESHTDQFQSCERFPAYLCLCECVCEWICKIRREIERKGERGKEHVCDRPLCLRDRVPDIDSLWGFRLFSPSLESGTPSCPAPQIRLRFVMTLRLLSRFSEKRPHHCFPSCVFFFLTLSFFPTHGFFSKVPWAALLFIYMGSN